MRLSSENAALLLSVAAVACLSSAILHWSSRDRARETLGEHALFGDLTDVEPVADLKAPLSPAPHPLNVNPIPSEEPQTSVSSDVQHAAAQQAGSPTTSQRDSQIDFVRFTEPSTSDSISHPPGTLPVSPLEQAAWLSGGIEEGTSEETSGPASAEPVGPGEQETSNPSADS